MLPNTLVQVRCISWYQNLGPSGREERQVVEKGEDVNPIQMMRMEMTILAASHNKLSGLPNKWKQILLANKVKVTDRELNVQRRDVDLRIDILEFYNSV